MQINTVAIVYYHVYICVYVREREKEKTTKQYWGLETRVVVYQYVIMHQLLQQN